MSQENEIKSQMYRKTSFSASYKWLTKPHVNLKLILSFFNTEIFLKKNNREYCLLKTNADRSHHVHTFLKVQSIKWAKLQAWKPHLLNIWMSQRNTSESMKILITLWKKYFNLNTYFYACMNERAKLTKNVFKCISINAALISAHDWLNTFVSNGDRALIEQLFPWLLGKMAICWTHDCKRHRTELKRPWWEISTWHDKQQYSPNRSSCKDTFCNWISLFVFLKLISYAYQYLQTEFYTGKCNDFENTAKSWHIEFWSLQWVYRIFA